jgi:hypothetical protein
MAIALLMLFSCASSFAEVLKTDQHRLIILADMGNEADEEQQMVHMLMCSNEFEVEGLIAVTGYYLRPENDDPYKKIVHPELYHQIIDGYEKVLPNLRIHASGWHEPDYLRSIVAEGQKGYGIGDIGEGKDSPAMFCPQKRMYSIDFYDPQVIQHGGIDLTIHVGVPVVKTNDEFIHSLGQGHLDRV